MVLENLNTTRKTRRWLRRGVILFLVAVALLTVVAFSLQEVRNLILYEVMPRYARDANLVRYTKESVDLHLLGTIHGKHLSTEDYSLAHLKAAIVHLNPKILLVEARPEEMARGRWGDGPVEMPFAALTAKASGIHVDGIDWWELKTDKLRRTDDERDDKIFANLIERLPTTGKVLVLVGFSHVPELAKRLVEAGFREERIDAEEKVELFELLDESFAYPAGMGDAIRQRIKDAEAAAASSSEAIARQYRMLAESRQNYLIEIEAVGEYPSSTEDAAEAPVEVRIK